MFWADQVAQDLKKRKLPLEWVDDMKTPSGKIHVGALRGVVIHDLVYKSLVDTRVKAKYTYVFEDHDPMDGLPVYLSKDVYEKYLGFPLYKVPSPVEGFENYARYYASDFQNVFNAIGCNPEIIWVTDLYTSLKINEGVEICIDNAAEIRKIYEETYKKPLPENWYPFQVYCENCGKVSTTKVTEWDGKKVTYICNVEGLDWTKGCGHKGAASPFSDKDHIAGKLPWKVEWPVKWKVIGVTVEGGGKDHMSAGGSYDISSKVAKRVLRYDPPYPVAYEHFLIGGKKMSSSKGVGSSASEMLDILPPEILRFLMVRTRINQAINFDPYEQATIPKLFDEYDKAREAYATGSDSVLARIFELSQVGPVKEPKLMRFSDVVNLLQMPGQEKELGRPDAAPRVKYAKIWLDRFAPEDQKFTVKEEIPEAALHLSGQQKEFLLKVIDVIGKIFNAEELQKELYEVAKKVGLSSKDAFAAMYLPLLGKDHGPKAAWLIQSLEKEFVIDRFKEAASSSAQILNQFQDDKEKVKHDKVSKDVFSIDKKLIERFPSISVGVAIIKNVHIEKTNKELEKEKENVLQSFGDLTTEQLGQYPEVLAYRRLYKEMGIDWHSRRPSPEALLRRVTLKKGLYTLNTCVDAYNLVVMRHRVSIGAFDMDAIEFPTVLRLAKKGEEILLLGDTEPTEYEEGEIAYFDKKGGFNIDFNYRDAQRTAVQIETKNLYVNVDGVYDISPEKVQQVLQETCDIVMKYCGGTLEVFGVETAR